MKTFCAFALLSVSLIAPRALAAQSCPGGGTGNGQLEPFLADTSKTVSRAARQPGNHKVLATCNSIPTGHTVTQAPDATALPKGSSLQGRGTYYAYPGDGTPDSGSSAGIGSSLVLEEGKSVGMTGSAMRKSGANFCDHVKARFANGMVIEGILHDTNPDKSGKLGNRFDLFAPLSSASALATSCVSQVEDLTANAGAPSKSSKKKSTVNNPITNIWVTKHVQKRSFGGGFFCCAEPKADAGLNSCDYNVPRREIASQKQKERRAFWAAQKSGQKKAK